MNDKYITKRKVVAANKAALEAGVNANAPAFLKTIPDTFQYPVDEAVPCPERPGFVRCRVGIGTTIPVETETFKSYLMDMPEKVYKALPTSSV